MTTTGTQPQVRSRAFVSFVPSTWDEQTREIDVVCSTGADVLRNDWWSGSTFVERLSLDPTAVRLGRFNSGAAVLASHNQWDINAQIGVIVDGSARIEDVDGRPCLVARVRLSERPEVAGICSDIVKGIIRNFSVGYITHAEQVIAATASSAEIRIATDWEPVELSAVPVPADAGAQTRTLQRGAAMTPEELAKKAAEDERARIAGIRKFAKTVRAKDEAVQALIDAGTSLQSAIEKLAAEMPMDDEEPEKDAAEEEAKADERALQATVKRMSEGKPADEVKSLKSRVRSMLALGETPRQVRDALLNEKADDASKTRTSPHQSIQGGRSHQDQVAEGIVNYLEHRMSFGTKPLTEAGKSFRGLRLLDMGRRWIEMAGGDVDGMGPDELAHAILRFRSPNMREMAKDLRKRGVLNVRAGAMATSDFPLLTANVIDKLVLEAYEEEGLNFLPISRQRIIRDLKEVHTIQVGEFPALLKVVEGAEYQVGTLAESREKYSLVKYGIIIPLTDELLINDDTDTLGTRVRDGGSAAARVQKDIWWGIVTTNGALSDSVTLFHATHRNLLTAAAPSPTAVGAMRASFKKQKGVDGTTKIALRQTHIMTPVDQENAFDQMFNGLFVPTASSGSMTPSLKMAVISEPRLDDNSTTAWYGAANGWAGIEHGYLEGENGPVTSVEEDFDRDMVKNKVKLYFGAKAADFRHIAKNPYAGA